MCDLNSNFHYLPLDASNSDENKMSSHMNIYIKHVSNILTRFDKFIWVNTTVSVFIQTVDKNATQEKACERKQYELNNNIFFYHKEISYFALYN